jgi:hypothetical protein
MSTLFKRGHCWVCGEPLLKLVGAQKRFSHCCSRYCRMMMADFEEFETLKFLLFNSRWLGGAGFRTLEQRMEEAVRNLPIGSELLALLLIELLEILDRRSIKKVDARICSIQPPSECSRESPVTRPVVKARKRR